MFEIQGPVTKLGGYLLKEQFVQYAADYVSVFPIMIGVAFGVYALLQMFNKSVAKTGGIMVFVYGALVLVA